MHVSQKIFIKNKEGKYLALRRSDTDPNRPLTWDMPGGQLEEGEDLIESIKRETREEAGIEISNVVILGAEAGTSIKNGEYWVQLGYTGEVDMPTVTLSYEHDQYEWLTIPEFLALESSEKLMKLAEKLNKND